MFVYGPGTYGDTSESETDSECDPETMLTVKPGEFTDIFVLDNSNAC